MTFDLPRQFHVYRTANGLQVCADSLEILPQLPAHSVDLVITSPPFALLRQKSYGNEDQDSYVSWLSEFGKAVFRVLKDTGSFPSGHDIAEGFGRRNGGAIPCNLLQIPNTDSNSHYLRTCKELHRDSHPARFPADLPRFFIKFLTDPGDLVVDIFSGSNTTGHVAEELDRRWLSIELDRHYAALSSIRFMDDLGVESIRPVIEDLEAGTFKSLGALRGSVNSEEVTPVVIQPRQTGLTFE